MPNQFQQNAHKNALRYRADSVRFRKDGFPYLQDVWNLAKDCGVEVYNGGNSWGAEIPKSFLGLRYGTRKVELGAVGEDMAFLAAVNATRRGRRILLDSIRWA